MKSDWQRKVDATAAKQLAAEIEWLVNEAGTEWRPRSDTAGSIRVDFRTLHPLVRPELATRIEEILCRPELTPLLNIIGQHNSEPRELPWVAGNGDDDRRQPPRLPQKDHLLLAPYLFQVLVSVESRNELHQQFPVVDQPAAEFRTHLQKIAEDCKALAALIGKGPQPRVALAGETSANEALKVFAPWTELFWNASWPGGVHTRLPSGQRLEP